MNTPNKLQSDHQFHKPNPCSRSNHAERWSGEKSTTMELETERTIQLENSIDIGIGSSKIVLCSILFREKIKKKNRE